MSIFTHPFMQHAFIAGTAIALICGLVGFFVVLRGQVFTGDALSHVAFTGSLAALAFGYSVRAGLFAATIGVALLLAVLGTRGRADDVVIGSVFAWMLGLGVLFLSIFTTSHATANSTGGVSVLFGSIFGLSARDTIIAVAIATVVSAALVVMARPLLFASLDEAVARTQNVPVRVLNFAFMILVGAAAAEATQAVGALLLLGLLAAPAAAAGHMTARPFRTMWLSAALAVGAVWTGLVVSYSIAWIAPSPAILFVAAVLYAIAAGSRRLRRPLSRRLIEQ